MNKSLLASVILATFVTLAGFGLLIPTVSHAGHNMDCPFAPGGTALCASPLSHAEHWHSAFTAALIELSVLISVTTVLFLGFEPRTTRDPQYERFRLRKRTPLRPSLLQELYSQGILNRKEPQITFAYY